MKNVKPFFCLSILMAFSLVLGSCNSSDTSKNTTTTASTPTSITSISQGSGGGNPTSQSTSESAHVHTFATTWTFDGSSHWHASTCGHTVTSENDKHTFSDWGFERQPSYTEPGTKYRTCTVCSYIERKAVPPLEHDHTPGIPVAVNGNSPSCMYDGWEEQVTYCTICGIEMSRETINLPATGHLETFTSVVDKPATCTEDGYHRETEYCSHCTYVVSYYEEDIPATGHQHTKNETLISYPATCTHDGEMFDAVICEDCGKMIEASNFRPIPATGHNYEVISTTPADFEHDGSETFRCLSCGNEKTEILPKLNHNYKDHGDFVSIYYHSLECIDEGYEDLVVNFDHTFDEWIVDDGSHFEEGVEYGICTHCGFVMERSLYNGTQGILHGKGEHNDYHFDYDEVTLPETLPNGQVYNGNYIELHGSVKKLTVLYRYFIQDYCFKNLTDLEYLKIPQITDGSPSGHGYFGALFSLYNIDDKLIQITQKDDDPYNSAKTYYIPASLKEVVLTYPFEQMSCGMKTGSFDGITTIERYTFPSQGIYVYDYNKKTFTYKNDVSPVFGSTSLGTNNVQQITFDVSAIQYCDWSKLQCDVAFFNKVQTIEKEAFKNANSRHLPDLSKLKHLETIKDDAFKNTAISEAILCEGVGEIGKNAFAGCSSLTDVSFPSTLRYIGQSAFKDCTSLTISTLPSGIEYVDQYAFDGVTLETIKVDGINYLDNTDGEHVYLVSVDDKTKSSYEISKECVFIGDNAFKDCDKLISIELPDNLIGIGHHAFDHCSLLESDIIFPSTIKQVGYYAFGYCTQVYFFEFEGTKAEWQNNVMKDTFAIMSGFYNSHFTDIKCSDGNVGIYSGNHIIH